MVSVIMPCYNDGKYIQDSIDSVLTSTYKKIEIIIVDDGSDDPNTIAVLKSINNPRIKIIQTNHIGPAAARNTGINNAKGEYILPVDADDKISSKYIEEAVDIMKQDLDVGIVYCQADLFGNQRGRWFLPEYSIEQMLLDNIIFVTSLFRKDDWEKVGGFDLSFEHGMEDYDFWLSLIESGKKVYQIPKVYFHYRIKSKSRTDNFMRDIQNVKDTYRVIQEKHFRLYYDNAKNFNIIIRDALIDKIFENRWLQNKSYFYVLMNKMPRVMSLIKKIVNLGRNI